MMYEEVFFLSVPFRSKNFDAFWHFLSFKVIMYIYSILLIRLKSPLCFVTLTLSLPTSPIGDVIADCQRRRSATWACSLTLFKVPH